MTLEIQTAGSFTFYFAGGVNWDRIGQRLTITNRTVSGLFFKTYRIGSPTGSVTMTVRKVSDDSVILTNSYGSIAAVSTDTGGVWIGVTFDTPTLVNQEVRILVEWSGTLGDVSNALAFFAVADVKASEYVTRYYGAGNGYTGYDATTYDATYYYIYSAADVLNVSTEPMTSVIGSTATGNGRISVFGSDAAVTQHGHCWATTTNPTTADSKTQNGAKSTLGTFTSAITVLVPGTTYYTRAYAIDSVGTTYGNNVSFVAAQPESAGEGKGIIAVVETRFHYLDAYGVERFWEGTIVT